jgi:CheY-like chemotaxis protein
MSERQTHPLGKAVTSSKVILLVEDDTDNAQAIIDLILKETPYHVLVADGPDVARAVHSFRPDLFIFDYLLPGINGIALYDQLHANRELEAIPTMIVSTAFEACKDDIESRHLLNLSKPFVTEDLLSLIETALA